MREMRDRARWSKLKASFIYMSVDLYYRQKQILPIKRKMVKIIFQVSGEADALNLKTDVE
jgi:hypothetical protein